MVELNDSIVSTANELVPKACHCLKCNELWQKDCIKTIESGILACTCCVTETDKGLIHDE